MKNFVANYYPQVLRLDMIGDDNMPIAGWIGANAHLKALSFVGSERVILFTIAPSRIIGDPDIIRPKSKREKAEDVSKKWER